MKKGRILILILCAVSILGVMSVISYAAGPKKPEMVMKFDVTDKAQITEVTTYFGEWNDQPAVWIAIKVKNVTDQPVQYKTRCTLHDIGVNRGSWVPNPHKPNIKPGKEGKASYPFTYNKLPKKITFVVQDVPNME